MSRLKPNQAQFLRHKMAKADPMNRVIESACDFGKICYHSGNSYTVSAGKEDLC